MASVASVSGLPPAIAVPNFRSAFSAAHQSTISASFFVIRSLATRQHHGYAMRFLPSN